MSEPINVLLPELIVRPRGSYITYTGKETNRPSVADFIKSKAKEARVEAANKILKQYEPDVPTVTRSITPFNGLAGLVMSEKTRRDVFGVDPYPFTCLYTATTKYGDKDAVATSNKILKRNPQKYGYEPVDMSNTEIGDLVQFSDNHLGGLAGKIIGPTHGTIVTDIDKNGKLKLSYSNGSTQPYEYPNEYAEEPEYTMKRDRPIGYVSSELKANPSALRYVGSPTKQMEWAEEYMQKFPRSSKKAEGGFLQPRDAWDTLSLKEKATMIKVAVNNGIYDLQTIKKKYNEFAEGGEVEEEELPPIVPFKQRTEVIITPDSKYNQYLNTLPDNQRFTPNDAYDSYFYWKLNGKPEDFKEAYSKGMFHYDHSDNSYHANSIAYGDDGTGYFMKPKTHDTVGYETDWFSKGLVTEEGGHQRPMTPEEKVEWLDFRRKYMLTSDPNRPNYYMYKPKNKHSIGGPLVDTMLNEYAEGGGIHIKPSHRGRLTELKKRTGKTEAELYRTGSAATRKMITFARNARKWKHEEGGHLYDGESEDSQKLVLGKKYWQQQAAQPERDYLAEMVEYNKKKEAERQQRAEALRRELAIKGEQIAKKRQKDYLTMSNDNTWVERNNGREKNPHLADRAVEGAKAHAVWTKEHPVLNTLGIIAGAAPFALAAAPVLATAGEATYPALTNPYVDAIGTSYFGADGTTDIVNGNTDAFTALEVLPMTRLVKPIFGNQERWRKAVYRNMRPYSYSKTLKALETPSVLFDYFSMRPLNVSEETVLPWQKAWGWWDDMPKVTDKAYGARRQAWAKYLGMPDNFEYPVYRTVGRTKEGREIVKSIPENIPLANGEQWNTSRLDKMINDVRKSATNKYDDYFGDGKYLRGNHQHIYAKDLGNDTYYFNDVWDIQPLFKYRSLPQFMREFEFGKPIGGKPFEWSEVISPEVDLYNNNTIQQYISHTPQ